MLFVRGGAVDFALGAQMSRELVTDEVGKAARLTLRPVVEQWTPQQPSGRKCHKGPQHPALFLSVLATDL
jgi:hypothetical protein